LIFEHRPRIDDVKAGSNPRILFNVKDVDGSVVDLSASTVSVVLYFRDEEVTVNKTGAVNGAGTAMPQIYVDLATADTAARKPQRVDVYATVTKGGAVYKVTCFFRLLESAPPS
jgi:hypothetical protein